MTNGNRLVCGLGAALLPAWGLLAFGLSIIAVRATEQEKALPGNAETMGLISHMVGDQVELGCDRFRLRFAADGKPLSFKSLPDGRELLDTKHPGDGFAVVNRAGQKLSLSRLTLAENGSLLIARTSEDGPEVWFQIHLGQSHIGFQVEKLVRFSPVPDLTLEFGMNVDKSIEAVPHNYMVWVRHQDSLEVKWNNLWTVPKGDVPGGFSLFVSQDAEDRDECLLRIWTEEPIVHPKIEGAWTYERAREWVARWQAKFVPSRGNILLEANNLADLYKGLEYAEAAGVSEVYLMPWVWRGEYWPIVKRNDGVNTNIFPQGEADIKAFSDAVEKRGMYLGFHWVDAGIGFSDPIYVGQHPDRRLASWGGGTVETAIDAKAREIRFKPAAGVYAPYHPQSMGASVAFPPGLAPWQGYNIVRVEDELIRFGELKNPEQDVWTFTDCERGYGSTRAAVHAQGAEAAGLIVTYGQNLIPDDWSTLLPEVAGNYAHLLNRVGVSHAEFDGFEINYYYGGVGEKMAEMLYSELDHPTVAGTSGGRPPAAWFEYRFSKSQGPGGAGKGAIVRLRSLSQNASSLLMADFGLGTGALQGSPTLGLSSGDRGFLPEVFAKHGLGPKILARMRLWREIALAMTPEQQKRFDHGNGRASGLGLAGQHNEVSVVYVPEPREGGWDIYPTAVMDKGEQNSIWYNGQENGPIEPWRFAKANAEEFYTNPFPEQPLRFIIHVLAATDYTNVENYAIPLAANAMTPPGDTKFGDLADGLQLDLQNPRDKDVWTETLPVITQKFPSDWSSHRPLGMYVEGDGKNEVFVISAHRDYAVPISFTGKRYIEIPHGEAAYALKSWGWRYGASKGCNYAAMSPLTLGIGYIPARTSVGIKVTSLKALKEIPVPLQDPTIVTVRGELQVRGEVPFDHYLEYQGGTTAMVYDQNWNKVSELPVTIKDPFAVPAGKSAITVKTAKPGPAPWLELQFLTRGEPVAVRGK